MSQGGVAPEVLILHQRVLDRRDEILSALGTSDDSVLEGIDFALLCLLGGESRPTKEELRIIKRIKRHAGELRKALTRLTHTGEYFILKQYRDGDEEAAYFYMDFFKQPSHRRRELELALSILERPDAPRRKGRPRNVGMYVAISELGKLWWENTGRPPGKPSSLEFEVSDRGGGGPFYRFLSLCFQALPPGCERTPSLEITRQVCDELPSRWRPTKR